MNRLFNNEVREHNKDYKSIPIIIISYNQLFYLRKLINFLWDNEYFEIIIIDNNSTYKPLLEYFDNIEEKVKIYKLSKNSSVVNCSRQIVFSS